MAGRAGNPWVRGAAGWESQALSDRPALGRDDLCRVRCAMAKVSGKSGGYYGCLGVAKNACENRVLVRRSLVERIVLAAVRDELMSAENIDYVLERVKKEVEKTSTEAPETISLREAECAAEERRVSNFVEFIAEGRGSRGAGRRPGGVREACRSAALGAGGAQAQS